MLRSLHQPNMADHEDLPQLPVIDLSAIDEMGPGSGTWEVTCGLVRKALEEYGCFEALYDKVTPELQNSLYTTLEDFFNLPSETKHDLARRISPDSPSGGYIANQAHSPSYHGIEVNGVPKTQANLHSPPRLGPDSSAGIIESYSERVVELEKIIKRLAFESLGVGKYLDSYIESTSFNLRMAKYEATDKESEARLGLVDHRDINFMTILHDTTQAAADGPGLEIATKDGKHWMKAVPSPSSFIVLIGQSFEAWSNGRFHSPVHRVVLGDGNKVRFSVGLFSVVTGTTIESPEELVDDQHPMLFKPFKWADLLLFYFQTADRHHKDILTSFCGV